MTESRPLFLFVLLAAMLYAIFLGAPDPLIRGAALWALVIFGFAGSLMFSWRDTR